MAFVHCAQDRTMWDYFGEPKCTDPEHHQWDIEGYVIHNRNLKDKEWEDTPNE